MLPENPSTPSTSSGQGISNADRSKKDVALLIVIAIVLILGVAYGIFKGARPQPGGESASNVLVKNETGQPPPGLPRGIPVETDNIVESYSADYLDRGVTQYTVSYFSAKPVKEKYAEYETYMTEAGYIFEPGAKNPDSNSLYGRKDNDDLSVVVSIREGRVLVQLSYLDR